MDLFIKRSQKRVKQCTKAFVLVEVLVSMTILAIAGTVLLRSVQNSLSASRRARDTAKIIFLAKSKIHEYEMLYIFKPLAPMGVDRGRFEQRRDHDFLWTAEVYHDKKRDAYIITVWVKKDDGVKHTRRYRKREEKGFKLVSMVPTARYNDYIVRGMEPSQRGGRR